MTPFLRWAKSIDSESKVRGKMEEPVSNALQQEVAVAHHGRKMLESRETYGPPGKQYPSMVSRLKGFGLIVSAGFRGLFSSHYVALCAAFSAMGGLLFGYEYFFRLECTWRRLC